MLSLDLVVERFLRPALTEDSAVDQSFKQDFLCLICAEVAWCPVKCTQCEKVFCEERCMRGWLVRHTECPGSCGANPVVTSKLGRYERNCLN